MSSFDDYAAFLTFSFRHSDFRVKFELATGSRAALDKLGLSETDLFGFERPIKAGKSNLNVSL